MSGFYKMFKIWGKSFIFLPSSMILFESNKDIEEVVKCAFEHPGQKNIPNNVKQLINIEKILGNVWNNQSHLTIL